MRYSKESIARVSHPPADFITYDMHYQLQRIHALQLWLHGGYVVYSRGKKNPDLLVYPVAFRAEEFIAAVRRTTNIGHVFAIASQEAGKELGIAGNLYRTGRPAAYTPRDALGDILETHSFGALAFQPGEKLTITRDGVSFRPLVEPVLQYPGPTIAWEHFLARPQRAANKNVAILTA